MFDEKDRPLNHSRAIDDDRSEYVRTDELKQIRIDRVSDQLWFIGRAVAHDTLTSDDLWQIQRIHINATNVEVKEFIAKGAYSQVYDDRASLFPAPSLGTGAIGGGTIIEPSAGPWTDGSGTATTVSAVVFAANDQRKALYIKNLGNKSIWIDFGTAAVASQPSIELLPNEAYDRNGSFVSTQSVNMRSDSLTQDFVAKEG